MDATLSELERKILEIASSLAEAKKTITIQGLYKESKRKLGGNSDAISNAIFGLILKKFINIGSKLTRDQILLNAKRNSIYNYVSSAPGCHLNEIKQFSNLKGQLCKWHLSILERFGYIYSARYLKYLTYFPKDFPKDLIVPFLSMKDANSYKIFLGLWENPVITLSDLKPQLDLELPTIKHHLNKLLDSQVVITQEINNELHYLLNQNMLFSLQKYINIEMPVLEDFVNYQNDILQEKIQVIVSTEDDETQALIDQTDLPENGTGSTILTQTGQEIEDDSQKKEKLGPITVLREYDYIGGGIRFKVAIQNSSKTSLMDFHITLIPTTQYEIDERVKMINGLKPGESRGVDFQLTPLTCGKSQVYGNVSFIDAFGEPHSVTIRPKEIWIKCPLVVPKKSGTSEIDRLKEHLSKGTATIKFSDLPKSDVFKLVRDQISALDLSEVAFDNSQLTITYAGMAKVTGNDMIIEAFVEPQIITLEVWTNDMKQATGFLAYIKNMIDLSIKAAEKLKGKVDKISQKIVDATDIMLKLEKLCYDCEKNWIISDIILSLNESLHKIERSFPDIIISEQIKNAIERIEDTFREGANIDTRSGIDLEFEAINWLKSLENIASNNLNIYKETFPEETEKISQLTILEENITHKIEAIEHTYALRITIYLMVIGKTSGISFCEFGLQDSELEPDLLSGFLSAIQSFGTELSKEDVPMKKIAYKNLEIELHAGEVSICALLANGQIRDHLSSMLKQFSKEFETKYIDIAKSWSGDVTLFKDVKLIFEKIFS